MMQDVTIPNIAAFIGKLTVVELMSDVLVEVYRCTAMGVTCGDCFRADVKYGCGWCQSTTKSSCEDKTACVDSAPFLQKNNNSCPHLEISDVC